ncbi:MAG: trypsin-like peptidase domain-containing protein [Oscillospiraceae bacterium]|nr:trypsin-like peptidase domain-containing protein [Oscillospiraceae bacterium]
MKEVTKKAALLFISVMIVISAVIPAFAAFDINDAAGSVVRVYGFESTTEKAGIGSAFVIAHDGGSTYLVTNRHCITERIIDFDVNGEPYYAGIYDFRDNTYIVLDDYGEEMLKATVYIPSEDLNDGLDIAILRVDAGLSDRKVLPLASVKTVKRGDRIYQLGFPGAVDVFFGPGDDIPSTEEHLTISTGYVTNLKIELRGTRYLQHTAPSVGGTSGGPIINERGAVVGVHAFAITAAQEYKGAVHIDYVIDICRELSIPYTLAGSAQDVDEPPATQPDPPGPGEPGSQPGTGDQGNQPGTGEQSDFDIASLLSEYWWVLAIVAGLIIILIASKKGKASSKASVQAPSTAAAPVQTPMQTPMQPPMSAGAGYPSASSASSHLICTRGHFAGTTFPINGSLSIGRDPKRCQVVFPGETRGISSLHCQLRQQGSSVTLIDSGSTYGTFLPGGRKLNANESVTLNSGDSFYLADTKNEFKVL